MTYEISQQHILVAPFSNLSMDSSLTKKSKPPTSTQLDLTNTMAFTSQRSPKPSSSKVDSFISHSKIVGPKTVEKAGKKDEETYNDNPIKFSMEFNAEKLNDSEERFKSNVHCIAAKDEEMKELLQGLVLYPSRRQSVARSGRRRRRRSIGGSQIELAEVFADNGVKMLSTDMPPFMQIHAVDSARKAYDSMEKFTSKSLALSLKKEFDAVYGPAWHCVVGRSFGSFVTHSVGGFLYFSMAQKIYILLFKTTVQRAD